MDSSMIPLLGFLSVSVLADRVDNIFLSDKSTNPFSYETHRQSLLLYDTCQYCLCSPP